MKKDKPGNNTDPNQFQLPSFYNQPTFSTSGQFQSQPPSYPPPLSNPPPNNGSERPPHNYRGWVLALFVLCCTFSWIFIIIEIAVTSGLSSSSDTLSSSAGILGTSGIILLIALNAGILLLDARSFLSLFGRIRW